MITLTYICFLSNTSNVFRATEKFLLFLVFTVFALALQYFTRKYSLRILEL